MSLIYYNDRYFWDEYEVLEYAIEDQELEEENFPITAYGTRKIYGSAPTAEYVAKEIFVDWMYDQKPHGWYHTYMSADRIADSYINSLYDDCEDDPPNTPFEGQEDLQKTIDFFHKLNTPLYWAFSRLKGFNPRVHALGLPLLDMALRHWYRLNRDKFYVWYPSKEKIEIQWEEP